MAEATVTLSASDQISAPTLKAIAALQQMQAAIDEVASAAKRLPGSTEAATRSARAMGETVGNVVPQRTASQALGVITAQLGEMAGASTAAQSAIRIFDNILVQLVMTGGMVSMAFVGITAAAVTLTSIITTLTRAHDKEAEALSAMVKKSNDAVLGLSNLTAAQRSAAGVALAEAGRTIRSLEEQIGNLNEKINQNVAASQRQAPSLRSVKSEVDGTAALSKMLGEVWDGLRGKGDALAASSVDMAGKMRILSAELDAARKRYDDLKMAAAGLGATSREAMKYGLTMAAVKTEMRGVAGEFLRTAEASERMGQAIGNRNIDFANLNKYLQDSKGTLDDYVKAWDASASAISGAVVGMVDQMGQALGEALVTGQLQWDKLMIGMVKTCLGALKQIGAMWMAASLMVSVGLGPQGFVAGLALMAVASIAEGFLNALTAPTPKVIGGADMARQASLEATGGQSVERAAGGPGGTAVSSAQSNITNNIVVNLPVQALDLSSISDMQLKSLAVRVGRVMAEAAGQGQLSFAGA